jgi:hypothetical protein
MPASAINRFAGKGQQGPTRTKAGTGTGKRSNDSDATLLPRRRPRISTIPDHFSDTAASGPGSRGRAP